MLDRKLVVSLLGKFGFEGANKLAAERAEAKLARRIEAEGIPTTASDAERKVAITLVPNAKDQEAPAKESKESKEPAKHHSKHGKPEKAEKPVEKSAEKPAKKPKAERAERKPRESTGAAAIFKNLLGGGKKIEKSEVFDKIISGAKATKGTVNSYIAWSKRPTTNKLKNPWGFSVVETKDDKGTKFLQRKK